MFDRAHLPFLRALFLLVLLVTAARGSFGNFEAATAKDDANSSFRNFDDPANAVANGAPGSFGNFLTVATETAVVGDGTGSFRNFRLAPGSGDPCQVARTSGREFDWYFSGEHSDWYFASVEAFDTS